MSLAFSDTTNKNGIIQHIERELGFEYGDISGDTDLLAAITADANEAESEVAVIYAEVGSDWDYDDSNHTKYPIVKTDLVSGQQDYTIDEDSDGNKITEIHKVMAKFKSSDKYQTLTQANQQSFDQDVDDFVNDVSGASTRYDLTANGIFLEKLPTTSVTAGILSFVSREGSAFTVSDTTKQPGYDPRFHYYTVHFCVEKYSRINKLATYDDALVVKLAMEDKMKRVLRLKNRGRKTRMVANVESTR